MKKYVGKLVGKSLEAESIMRFDFKIVPFSESPQFSFIPGQYVMISFKGEDDKRAFSIVDFENDVLTLCIKKYHDFTSRLFDLDHGSEIDILGPFGRFIVPPVVPTTIPVPLVLIAGGIGITPFISMMKYAPSSREINLFYTARKKEDMALLDMIDDIVGKKKNLNVNLFTTREGNCERISYSTLKDMMGEKLNDSMVYICGPQRLMDDLVSQFKSNGIKEDNIKLESF